MFKVDLKFLIKTVENAIKPAINVKFIQNALLFLNSVVFKNFSLYTIRNRKLEFSALVHN